MQNKIIKKENGFYNIKSVEEGDDKDDYLIIYYNLIDE